MSHVALKREERGSRNRTLSVGDTHIFAAQTHRTLRGDSTFTNVTGSAVGASVQVVEAVCASSKERETPLTGHRTLRIVAKAGGPPSSSPSCPELREQSTWRSANNTKDRFCPTDGERLDRRTADGSSVVRYRLPFVARSFGFFFRSNSARRIAANGTELATTSRRIAALVRRCERGVQSTPVVCSRRAAYAPAKVARRRGGVYGSGIEVSPFKLVSTKLAKIRLRHSRSRPGALSSNRQKRRGR